MRPPQRGHARTRHMGSGQRSRCQIGRGRESCARSACSEAAARAFGSTDARSVRPRAQWTRFPFSMGAIDVRTPAAARCRRTAPPGATWEGPLKRFAPTPRRSRWLPSRIGHPLDFRYTPICVCQRLSSLGPKCSLSAGEQTRTEWRKRTGIEPAEDLHSGPPLDLKSKSGTSPPRASASGEYRRIAPSRLRRK